MTQKAVLTELVALQKKDIAISYGRSKKTYYRLAETTILRVFDP
jgi:hypothetical protein